MDPKHTWQTLEQILAKLWMRASFGIVIVRRRGKERDMDTVVVIAMVSGKSIEVVTRIVTARVERVATRLSGRRCSSLKSTSEPHTDTLKVEGRSRNLRPMMTLLEVRYRTAIFAPLHARVQMEAEQVAQGKCRVLWNGRVWRRKYRSQAEVDQMISWMTMLRQQGCDDCMRIGMTEANMTVQRD